MLTAPKIKAMKGSSKITMLTAYEYLTASYLEKASVDIILVGDSLGMVFQGEKETLPVTVDEIIYHAKAVRRGAPATMVAVDMPFMSYQASVEQAMGNGGKIIKQSRANCLKLEGGVEICPQIRALVKAGIPVVGHIGLQPQSVNFYGGYPVQGVLAADAQRLINDARELEKAGVFAIVVEKVKASTTKKITAAVNVPVIGIGAGPHCDGQVLVTHDMLGAFVDFKPSFVKLYEKQAMRSIGAIKRFSADVKRSAFPSKKYYY
jgi:3-methyl-2-oxobutanoate hydroxymethyltransferase